MFLSNSHFDQGSPQRMDSNLGYVNIPVRDIVIFEGKNRAACIL